MTTSGDVRTHTHMHHPKNVVEMTLICFRETSAPHGNPGQAVPLPPPVRRSRVIPGIFPWEPGNCTERCHFIGRDVYSDRISQMDIGEMSLQSSGKGCAELHQPLTLRTTSCQSQQFTCPPPLLENSCLVGHIHQLPVVGKDVSTKSGNPGGQRGP